jgi:hypothetical protein
MRKDVALCYGGLIAITLAPTVVTTHPFLQMLVTTVLTIYIGCRGALSASNLGGKEDWVSARPPRQQEMLQSKDVYYIPIVGSCVLFSLYLLVKFVSKQLLLVVLKLYFVVAGSHVIGKKAVEIAEPFLDKALVARLLEKQVTVPIYYLSVAGQKIDVAVAAIEKVLAPVLALIPDESRTAAAAPKADGAAAAGSSSGSGPDAARDKPEELQSTMLISQLDAIGYCFGIAVGAAYLITNHWITNNVFGVIFSITAIEMTNLGSFRNGALLLVGLFFYDVFWVFGTEVMVTVAKNIDGPIKLIYPRGEGLNPSILGLGDIVIPGFFIAMVLRFDWSLAKKTAQGVIDERYFRTCLIAYAGGITATFLVMIVFNAAQPALLYLVPACLGSVLVLAMKNKETDKLTGFTETEVEAKPAEASPAAAAKKAT